VDQENMFWVGAKIPPREKAFWGNTLACPDLSADVLNLIRKVAAFGYQYCSNLFNVISDSFLDTVQRDLGTWTPC